MIVVMNSRLPIDIHGIHIHGHNFVSHNALYAVIPQTSHRQNHLHTPIPLD